MKKTATQKSNSGGTTVKFLLVLVSVTLTLVLGELAVRAVGFATKREPIIISDGVAGWAGKQDLEKATVVFGGSQFTISTDHEGNRRSYPSGQSPPAGAPALLVVGDSFAQGIGVDDEQTFSWRIARRIPYNVINLGVVCYGTDQELVKLEGFMASRPDLVVKHIIVVVFDNDFTDVQKSSDPALGRTKPLFQVSDRKLVRANYERAWMDYMMDDSRLFWLLNSKLGLITSHSAPDAETGIDVVLGCLQSMRHLAESRSAQIHIFAYRRLDGSPPVSESAWKRFVDESAATDITERVRAAQGANPIGSDGIHWSASGHAVVADTLLEFLK